MFENDTDWAISSQAVNSGRFNDYPAREYTASAVEVVRIRKDEDIVYSLLKNRVTLCVGAA